jgi:hypothetical protein
MALSNFVCPKSGTKIASKVKESLRPYLMSSPALKVRSEPISLLIIGYMEL